ncbi:hypothetical protein SLS62_003776 [Diatrype stigma]|uniref:Pentatricopeptide repeat-containing protein n=1 Tax=Diatrype stigma TaxID=117547 RepID=A0AAN9V4A0_9PEZI
MAMPRGAGLKRPPPQKHPDQLNALFQQIVTEQQSFDRDGKPTGTPTSQNVDLAHVHDDIAKLYEMVEDGPPEAAYVYLKTVIYPALQRPGVGIPPIFYKVVLDLMKKMVVAKKADMLGPGLPTVAEIFQTYADIGQLKPREWAELVGELVQILVNMGTSDSSTEGRRDIQAALLTDLVESWKVLSAPKFYNVTPSSQDGEIFDGFWFPSFNKYTLQKYARTNNFIAAFNTVFPQYDQVQLGPPVAALTVATYVLLQDRVRSTEDARRSTARFTSNVAYLITHVGIENRMLEEIISATFPGLKDYIMGEWPQVKARLEHHARAEVRVRDRRPSPSLQTLRISRRDGPAWAARLNQAYLARNVGEVDRIWTELVGVKKDLDQGRIELLQDKIDLIDNFVNVFMALSQPENALKAWGLYKQIGLSPKLKTWNAMLDGCKKARNLPALRNIWAKLMSSGMELDTRIWTTRISGLIESGDTEAGLRALDEMVRLWKQAKEGKRPHAVQPTIEPVNAALAGLIHQKMPLAVEKLLDWARRQGIKPDIFSYNMLLRPMIREGRNKDARNLFETMLKQGVRADAATFTVVLDAALTKIDPSSSPEEFDAAQKEVVAQVLSQMEAVGLETNLLTYGKMIYLLLQSGGRSREAIKAVLAHLWEQGFELSPHIYTMLVEHYFAQRPPDLASVDALLQRQQLQKAGTTTAIDGDGAGDANANANNLPEMDRVFHDRVVKGYARAADDPGRALDLFYRLSSRGYLVTLGTQLEVLLALLRHGRWDDARALVDHTRKRFHLQSPNDLYGGGGDGNRSTASNAFWKHGFWVVAEQNHLLEQGWEKDRELSSASSAT